VSRSDRPLLFLLLGGAAVLTVLSAVQLPSPRQLLRAPSTPFDRTSTASAAPEFRLLLESASAIPTGASVCVVAEPRDPQHETWLHRAAIGLLPGRRVIPAALWDIPTNEESQAEFRIVAGRKPSVAPGELVLQTPAGTVWRRRSG
jgi:hypothetical protein